MNNSPEHGMYAVGQPTIVQDEDQDRRPADCIDTLRELTRHGYVPDPRSPESSGSIRLRHPVAPDLVLRGNGALELPLGQSLKSGEALPVASTRKRWAVGLLILLGIALYVFVSLGLVSTIISD
jgi:hypothetical protein